MDIFIELTATIMQNFLIIWFISGYCGYKYNGWRFVCYININVYYILSYMFEKRLVFSYIYILFCYGRNIHVIKCYFFLNIELDK